MWKKLIAIFVVFAVPNGVSAGPLKQAVEKVAREMAAAQQPAETRNPARMWTGLSLIAGGVALTTLGAVELGDDEDGPDDGEDLDDSDDGEDEDGWGNKALVGGGVAAAALGAMVLFTGRSSGPSVSVNRGRIAVRQTLRF